MDGCFQENERAVTTEEGMALAQEHKCLFFECSAKTQANVKQCFKDLTLKVLFTYQIVNVPSSHCLTFQHVYFSTDTGRTKLAGERIYARKCKEPDFEAKASWRQWKLLLLVEYSTLLRTSSGFCRFPSNSTFELLLLVGDNLIFGLKQLSSLGCM